MEPQAINWEMVKAMALIMSSVMSVIGILILTAAKSIFITQKEYKDMSASISKLYDEIDGRLYKDGLSIFMPRREYEKETAEKSQRCTTEFDKCHTGIRRLSNNLVPRDEWVKSKDHREKRQDEVTKEICDKIDKISDAINKMGIEQNKTNIVLGNLMGKLEIQNENKTLTEVQK